MSGMITYALNTVSIGENCIQVHYQGDFNADLDEDLDEFFSNHGYSRWASGYGGSVRDIGYEKTEA